MARNNILIIVLIVFVFIVMSKNSAYDVSPMVPLFPPETISALMALKQPSDSKLFPIYNKFRGLIPVLQNATVSSSIYDAGYINKMTNNFIPYYQSSTMNFCDYSTLTRTFYYNIIILLMNRITANETGIQALKSYAMATLPPPLASETKNCSSSLVPIAI